jgi:hypothetical protein
MSFTDTPTVFIVDDDASVREGMAWLLRRVFFEHAAKQLPRGRQWAFCRATLAPTSGLHFAGREDARHEWFGPV